MTSRFTLLVNITPLWKKTCQLQCWFAQLNTFIQLINIHTQISLHKDYRTIYMSANFFLNVFLWL